MSGKHRRNDRRGLMVPAVAAILVALGLVLIAAGATTASRRTVASGPPAPLPVQVVNDDDVSSADAKSEKRDRPKNDDKSKKGKSEKGKSEKGKSKKGDKKGDKKASGKKTSGASTKGQSKAPNPVAAPVRLEIPRLSIDEPLVDLGLTSTGQIAAPKDYDAPGWFTEGPRPGERGAAVIAGHVDDEDGPAIFYHLSALQRGDTVEVERADGSSVTFEVTRVTRHPQDDFPVDVFHADDRELRLITCGGEFTDGEYTHNVVVYADKR